MRIKIIQWNIKINSGIDKIVKFLESRIEENTIVNLQEVSRFGYEYISKKLDYDNSFSLDYRSPGRFEGKNRKMGLMTLVSSGEILASELISISLFPERTLYTKVKIAGSNIHNLTFHSLTGVDYKKAKSSNFASIASFIAIRPVDIMSCDANEPKTDAINEDDLVFFDNRDKGKMAGLLFGSGRIHNLIDTYRYWAIKYSQPIERGYTHITGKNKKRYDHIYCRKDWNLVTSKVFYSESLEASSDHGLLETIVEV